jgi:hypothetical protein
MSIKIILSAGLACLMITLGFFMGVCYAQAEDRALELKRSEMYIKQRLAFGALAEDRNAWRRVAENLAVEIQTEINR